MKSTSEPPSNLLDFTSIADSDDADDAQLDAAVERYVDLFRWFLDNAKARLYWSWIALDRTRSFRLDLCSLQELCGALQVPVRPAALRRLLIIVTRNPCAQQIDFLRFCTIVSLWRHHREQTCREFLAFWREYPDEVRRLIRVGEESEQAIAQQCAA